MISDRDWELVDLLTSAVRDVGPIKPKALKEEAVVLGYTARECERAFNIMFSRPHIYLDDNWCMVWRE